ncbi:hypothetical protein J6590_048806 [Homalodisca vitripennis]|nr:hypothetical protein J6590_048806 [Homalodisca vitripennis]
MSGITSPHRQLEVVTEEWQQNFNGENEFSLTYYIKFSVNCTASALSCGGPATTHVNGSLRAYLTV